MRLPVLQVLFSTSKVFCSLCKMTLTGPGVLENHVPAISRPSQRILGTPKRLFGSLFPKVLFASSCKVDVETFNSESKLFLIGNQKDLQKSPVSKWRRCRLLNILFTPRATILAATAYCRPAIKFILCCAQLNTPLAISGTVTLVGRHDLQISSKYWRAHAQTSTWNSIKTAQTYLYQH